MRAKLLCRLERLEAQAQDAREEMVEIGALKRLPADFLGDRHVVVTKRYQSSTPNWETCEFEERPGPSGPSAFSPSGTGTMLLEHDCLAKS
jgi:hypothetical protein